MAHSTKVSKTGVWLLLGVLGLAGAQSAACSAPFHSCHELRRCPKETQAEAGAAGDESAGASAEAGQPAGGAAGAGRGGAGDGRPEAGASGTDEAGSDQAGQAGALPGTPLSCEPGTYACDNACVPDGNVSKCGASCSVCPSVAHGSPACIGGTCSVQCATGYHVCNQQCVDSASVLSCGTGCEPCTVPSGGSASCNSGVCGATCPSGKKLCSGACIAADAACSGSCDAGLHACSGLCLSNSSANSCGNLCAPCPLPPGASAASCDGATCGFTCSSGYHRCGAACAANNDVTQCGTSCTACTAPANATAFCNGTSCAFTCKPGYTGTNCEYPRMQATPLPTGYVGARIYAMSDDGSIVVGSVSNVTDDGGNRVSAFRWTTSSPTMTTGSVTGQINAWASTISGDGTRIYGSADRVAFEWRLNQAPAQLLNLPVDTRLNACSTNGLVVVGLAPVPFPDTNRSIIYDVASATILPNLPPGIEFVGISGDGLTAVASGTRWTSTGTTTLPNAQLSALSPNGQYAVGAWGTEGVRLSGPGLQTVTQLGKLATLPNWSTEARDVSQDGTVVVGRAFGPMASTYIALLWTPAGGWQKLSDALADAGIDVSDWGELQEAAAVSTNGKIIAGTGVKGGVRLGFVARMP